MGVSFYTATTQLMNRNLINSCFWEPAVYTGLSGLKQVWVGLASLGGPEEDLLVPSSSQKPRPWPWPLCSSSAQLLPFLYLWL